jgi:hypothetical protein
VTNAHRCVCFVWRTQGQSYTRSVKKRALIAPCKGSLRSCH